jgi:hypothetical protein
MCASDMLMAPIAYKDDCSSSMMVRIQLPSQPGLELRRIEPLGHTSKSRLTMVLMGRIKGPSTPPLQDPKPDLERQLRLADPSRAAEADDQTHKVTGMLSIAGRFIYIMGGEKCKTDDHGRRPGTYADTASTLAIHPVATKPAADLV